VITDSPWLVRCSAALVEPLESRRLCSVTVPSVTGHFNGGIFFNSGQADRMDLFINYQQKSKFSGTFTQGDGSAGVLIGSVNKRGIAKFTFQSTNLISNYKGKAVAEMDGTGDALEGDFVTRLGTRSATGTFSVSIDILDKKSG
jgi:hypothetical protein